MAFGTERFGDAAAEIPKPNHNKTFHWFMSFADQP
jgi:hypothetical protein